MWNQNEKELPHEATHKDNLDNQFLIWTNWNLGLNIAFGGRPFHQTKCNIGQHGMCHTVQAAKQFFLSISQIYSFSYLTILSSAWLLPTTSWKWGSLHLEAVGRRCYHVFSKKILITWGNAVQLRLQPELTSIPVVWKISLTTLVLLSISPGRPGRSSPAVVVTEQALSSKVVPSPSSMVRVSKLHSSFSVLLKSTSKALNCNNRISPCSTCIIYVLSRL